MARILVIAVMVVVACGGLWADQVRIGNLTYYEAKVLGADTGLLRFRTSAGNEVEKPVAEVNGVSIEAAAEFNQAERFAAKGQYVEAAALYRRVLAESTGPTAEVARYRLVVALKHAGPVDKATALWLALAAEPGAAARLQPLRPDEFAAPGSQANAKAIILLESARAKREISDHYRAAVGELLLAMYDHEGRKEESAALAREMTGYSSARQSTEGRPAPDQSEARFRALAALIDLGQSREVLAEVQGGLDQGTYRTGQLPWAFLLLGKARQEMADELSGDEKRGILILAGLDLMRVVTFFPASPPASEALLAAGEVNASLGNADAARKAWQLVVASYPAGKPAKTAKTHMQTLLQERKKEHE